MNDFPWMFVIAEASFVFMFAGLMLWRLGRPWLADRRYKRHRLKEKALDDAWFERLHEGTVLVMGNDRFKVRWDGAYLIAVNNRDWRPVLEPRMRQHFVIEEPSGPW